MRVKRTCHGTAYCELPEMSSSHFAANFPSIDPFVVCTFTQPPEREVADPHILPSDSNKSEIGKA
jgi:hypothetical protein